MKARYKGPLRGEPLPVEFHNTLYAVGGDSRDGLDDEAGLVSWLVAMRDQLPLDPALVEPVRRDDFLRLRDAVRAALRATLDGQPVPSDAVTALNQASAASPRSLALSESTDGRRAHVVHHGPEPADVVLGVLASGTIELVGGPRAGSLRACGAPRCVLMFIKDHPRREWCSTTCGNRARQARHYARIRSGE